jgi:hypothetical protein
MEKTYTLKEILKALKAGKKVRCKDWPKWEYIWQAEKYYIYFPHGLLDEKSFEIVNPTLWEIIE